MAAAIPAIDVDGMCDDVDDQVIVLCRAVQHRVIEPALASPTVADSRAATS